MVNIDWSALDLFVMRYEVENIELLLDDLLFLREYIQTKINKAAQEK